MFCNLDDNILQNTIVVENPETTKVEAAKNVMLRLELSYEIKNHRLLEVYPNPSSTNYNFNILLENPTLVTIQLSDIFGNNIVEQGYYPAGEQIIQFNNTSSLSNGVINYTIQLGEELHTGYLIKL